MKLTVKRCVKKTIEKYVTEENEVKLTQSYSLNVVEEVGGTLKTILRVTDYRIKPYEQEIAEILFPYIKDGRKVFASVFENYTLEIEEESQKET